MQYTTILIQPSTRLQLKKIGKKDETYNKIILELLKYIIQKSIPKQREVEIKTMGYSP